MISCLGSDTEHFWAALNQAEGEGHELPLLPPLEIPKLVDSKTARRMDHFSLITLVTSIMAFSMRGLEKDAFDPYRVGTVYNTGYGPINNNISYARKLVNEGVDFVSPTMFASTVYNACVGHVCIHHNLKGASTMLMGSNHIGYSADLLKAGKADIILAGATEEYCKELSDSFHHMAYANQHAGDVFCKPFDLHRGGTKLTEGSAVLVLEREGNPLFDQTKCLCEVRGYASSYSRHNPIFAVEKFENKALVHAMSKALEEAELKAEEIDGIIAAADGNLYGDLAEAQAIRQVFADTYQELPVTSIKGYAGETLSAAFSLSVAAAALCLTRGRMFPASGYDHPDPEIGLRVLAKPLEKNFRHILVNGYDVGGNVHSIVLSAI